MALYKSGCVIVGSSTSLCPVPAIADHVDDHIAAELVAVLEREASHADNGIDVLGVHVKNWDALPTRQLCREARGMELLINRRESDQVVDDDVQSSAHAVGRNIGKVQGFGKHALAGKCAIAVYQQWQKFLTAAFTGTILLGARTADR